jgi:hypothetical protein
MYSVAIDEQAVTVNYSMDYGSERTRAEVL